MVCIKTPNASLHKLLQQVANSWSGCFQFVVYGCYFLLIGAVFLFMAVVTMTSLGWRNCWSQRFVQSSQGPPPEEGLSIEERPPLGGGVHASNDQSDLLNNEEVPNYAV